MMRWKNRLPRRRAREPTIATRIEIKKAYHAKMLAYHPDKVANLAEEFQELAHQKTIEIRASYEALLKVVG